MKLKLVEPNKTSSPASRIFRESNKICSIGFDNFKVQYDSLFSFECSGLNIEGNVIAVLGHNGAGKSTLIKAILGLLPLLKGSLNTSIIGEPLLKLLKPEQHMAFCPETGSVFTDIPVESYIKLWCRIKHGRSDYYKREGSNYIEHLDIAPLFSKLGRELSKGQRRRVQTAIGFLTNPELFLFDEPFDGLDVQKTHELVELIDAHRKKMAFVISSHRMDVVERLADTLIVLDEGRVLTYGSLEQVCHELAGKSLILEEVIIPDSVIEQIQKSFPSLLINRIGNRVSLTGEHIDQGAIDTILNTNKIQQVKYELLRPNLVDAMNYHLRNHGVLQKSTNT